MDLTTPLSQVSGIGTTYAQRLQRLGLYTVADLINHYPFRFEDFSQEVQVSELKVGEKVTLRGELWSIKNTYTRFGKVLTQAVFNDGKGSIDLTWFNQPWLTKTLKVGDQIQISGKVNRRGTKITIAAPQWEKISEQKAAIHTGRLVPIYPETYGLTSKWIRQKISLLLPIVLPNITDPLPDSAKDNLLALPEALQEIHFPKAWGEVEKARERLSFDELFYIHLATLKKRADWKKKETIKPLAVDQALLNSFIKSLPFTLTEAQLRVTYEIISDIKKDTPMNRLVQGEVGSGKTVVAAVIIYLAHLNKLGSILMAPTEILAFQHHQTLTKLLSPFGIEVGIYTGSRKKAYSPQSSAASKPTKQSNNLTINHSLPVIVGTHALLSDKLNFENVGLVVIDEQQRFGVEQRSFIRSRARSPHFLTMTATPIPRTVALTLYGDLDLSIIDQLPTGRKPVKTFFVPAKKRADSYKFIKKHLAAGEQAYLITPLIEESETLKSAKAAKVEFEKLKKIFQEFKVGLLHGRLKSKEKEEAINAFKEHKIDLIVSTSVVEVGVDVPNATVMVVEGAERFGLAALHQLRGRVGRGEKESFAFLFTETEIPAIVSRLKNLETIYDGLKLAELDLKIRGSGELYGTAQSGRWNLKIADLSDLSLIEKTRTAAEKILAESPSLDKYPALASKLAFDTKVVAPD